MKMIIANKNYSSWSMRPWLSAKVAGIEFDEETVWLRHADTSARLRGFSPSGKAPILVDEQTVVFESLAIVEYLAEIAPTLWPKDPAARAHARSISSEMHAGFMPLRRACPMNIKRKPKAIVLDPDVEANVARIAELISDCRARFGGQGSFLFGDSFGNADAMWAPVVNRLHVYDVAVPPVVRAYMEAIMATPMWREWEAAALAESEIIAEIDAV